MTLTTPRRFLLQVALLTAVCVALAAASSVGALDIVVGIPLAVLLPGAALISAIDPWHRQLQGPERVMWSVGSSIGIVIMGGLILNLTGGLTRSHWLILIAAAVGLLVVVGYLRAGMQDAPDGSASRVSEGSAARGLALLSFRPVALMVVAVVVVVGGLVLSQRSNAESTREHFVQAWILPQPTGNVFSTKATLGVRNEEGGHQRILVEVKVGRAGSTMTVGLRDGQAWTHQITRTPGQAISVTVALASNPSSILDRVDLAKPT
jgi:uncharacterized membrane protein